MLNNHNLITNNLVPIILSGGNGERLWPVSKKDLPKQFMKINNDKYSFFQKTIIRFLNKLEKMIPYILVVCNESNRFLVKEQILEINNNKLDGFKILLEPSKKDTAAAIIAASNFVKIDNPENNVIISPSDHFIYNDEELISNIAKNNFMLSNQVSLIGLLNLYGIKSKEPNIGYGYIETEDNKRLKKIKKFKEKPDLNTAKKYVDKGFFWNLGMFHFNPNFLIKYLTLEEKILNKNEIEELRYENYDNKGFYRISEDSFNKLNLNKSFDIEIIEKMKIDYITCTDISSIEWSDIGSWKNLFAILEKDNNYNSLNGKNIYTKNVTNSYIQTDNKLTVVSKLDNISVINHEGVLYISDKDDTDNLKDILRDLEKENMYIPQESATVHRPWGNYKSLSETDKYQVKTIVVKPGEKLSLQYHYHRAEHWIVVSGVANVTIDDEVKLIRENESIYIPRFAKHRLENPGKIPLVLIEVQVGQYLGEDDIVRIEDTYGRE